MARSQSNPYAYHRRVLRRFEETLRWPKDPQSCSSMISPNHNLGMSLKTLQKYAKHSPDFQKRAAEV